MIRNNKNASLLIICLILAVLTLTSCTPTITPSPTVKSTATPSSPKTIDTTPAPTPTPIPVITAPPPKTPIQPQLWSRLLNFADKEWWDAQVPRIGIAPLAGQCSLFSDTARYSSGYGRYTTEEIRLDVDRKCAYFFTFHAGKYLASYDFWYVENDTLASFSDLEKKLSAIDYCSNPIYDAGIKSNDVSWESYKGGLLQIVRKESWPNYNYTTEDIAWPLWIRFERDRIVKIYNTQDVFSRDVRKDVDFYVQRGVATGTVSRVYSFVNNIKSIIPTEMEPSVSGLFIDAEQVNVNFKDLQVTHTYFENPDKDIIIKRYQEMVSYLRNLTNYYDTYTKRGKEKIGNYLVDIFLFKYEETTSVLLLFQAAPNILSMIVTNFGRVPALEEIKIRTENYLSLLNPSLFK
jgi:hypothetical protein